jgi:hypothetical protein
MPFQNLLRAGQLILFLRFLSLCVGFVKNRNEMPLTQQVDVISLVWRHVLSSKCHLEASLKYIKEIVHNFVFKIEIYI